MSDRLLALVTGASRGIGAATARRLAEHGFDVLLGGRDQAALDTVAQEITSTVEGQPTVTPLAVDLTDYGAMAEAVAGINQLDVLVHSAGIVHLAPIAESTVEQWRETYEINVVAVVELTRLLLPALRGVGGHVMLINSGAGQQANVRRSSYAASKFALRAFADVLRQEETDLRVTTVYPGPTATDMQRGMRESEHREYEPNKYLRPESVAATVCAAACAPPDAHVHEVVVRPHTSSNTA